MSSSASLLNLPIELLYSIHLLSTSQHLPYVCKHLFNIFNQTSTNYRASYLLQRFLHQNETRSSKKRHTSINVVTFALTYPICNEATLEALVNLENCPEMGVDSTVLLPRRLFKGLVGEGEEFTGESHPLPFLRYLFNRRNLGEHSRLGSRLSCSKDDGDGVSFTPSISKPNKRVHQYTIPAHKFPSPWINSHEGYALVRAVHAGHIPLIHFLLSRHATPSIKDNLATRVAIRKRDLSLVKTLVESSPTTTRQQTKGKRRKVADRVEITVGLLKEAVSVGSKDIVEYFIQEKGVCPDMSTLSLMERRGFFDTNR